jgi:hypothetical protein
MANLTVDVCKQFDEFIFGIARLTGQPGKKELPTLNMFVEFAAKNKRVSN